MARTPIWKSIAQTLQQEIRADHYGPGDKLPTEAALAARFGVNRHTVRHALKSLSDEGLVFARRGAGVFVTQVPTDYPIGKRVRFHQNLISAGRVPAKELLSLETRSASATEREMLCLEKGQQVHVYEGLSLADRQPIALFHSTFPATRFAKLPQYLAKSGSVTAALSACGVTDYTRASTRLKAKSANPMQALHLKLAEGAPLLYTSAINVDLDGKPVEFGKTWFAGERLTLTI
ncbi:MAG: phosphonate metabolism transcriptional regulator PhnF [Pseudomonadota bacterium]